jgi:ADP-ribosylglycohydrolase
VAPGRPDIAAHYAYLDGIIAHERNGVYGEIYDAVLISLAFVEKDPGKLLELALEYVPQKSRLYKVVTDTFEIAESSKDWRQARERICESWIYDYHRVHTFPNLAFVVTALMFGEGDFEQTICIVNMCGLDTDCSVGQAAAIMGVILGAEAIPAKWKEPIEDRFDSFVIGFEHQKISQVAELTCEWGRRILEEKA